MRYTHLGIIGTGGFGREVLQLVINLQKEKSDSFSEINFVEFDEYFEPEIIDNTRVLKLSNCNLFKMKFVIAIGDPMIKNKIIKQLPNEMEFISIISPLAFIATDFEPREGVIIMPFSYVSCNVELGKHVHINSHCTIGHDTVIGDFSTTACSVMISGNNDIGKCCYFGMNSSTRQNLSICENVTVGLNSGVVKDINKAGTYIGTPSKLLS